MSEGKRKKVPELRFKGFEGEWERQELESISTSVSSNSLSRAKLNYKIGAAKNIHYGDILLHFDAVVDTNSPELPFITEQDSIDKLSGSDLKVGDIIFADAAEDRTVGKSVELVKTERLPIFAGLHTIAFRPTINFSKAYLGYYTNSEIYRKQLYPLMQGTKVLSLSRNSLKSTCISYPRDLQEQQKIGHFFQQLDTRIRRHQARLDKLKKLKQAMLQKMFPQGRATEPEIRFKGFMGEWEKKALGDITWITMGQSPSGANYTDNPRDYILVQGNADLKNGCVVPRGWTTQVTKMAKAGDLIFGVRAPVGSIARTDFDVVLGRGVAGLQGDDFIYYLLEKMDSDGYWKQFSAGSTFESISSTSIASSLLLIPASKEEQQKIGTYFRKLDDLITLERTQLEKLKQIKQACLSRMFV